MLAELPDPNKLVAFDRNRRIMTTMAENVERATREQLAELVQLLVERVTAKERVIDPTTIEWTPPARPFFGKVRGYGAPGRARGLGRQTTRPAGVVRGEVASTPVPSSELMTRPSAARTGTGTARIVLIINHVHGHLRHAEDDDGHDEEDDEEGAGERD